MSDREQPQQPHGAAPRMNFQRAAAIAVGLQPNMKPEPEGVRPDRNGHSPAKDEAPAQGVSPTVRMPLPGPVAGPVAPPPLPTPQAPQVTSAPIAPAAAPSADRIPSRPNYPTARERRAQGQIRVQDVATRMANWQPTKIGLMQRLLRALKDPSGEKTTSKAEARALPGFSKAIFHTDPLTITVCQAKGGSGKTTTAWSLAAVAGEAAAGDALDIVLCEASRTTDLHPRLGLTVVNDQADYLDWLYQFRDEDQSAQMERCLMRDEQIPNLRYLLAPADPKRSLSDSDFLEIAEALPRYADVIVYDTDASFPSGKGEDATRLRSLLQRSHAVLVPIRPEPASIMDGMRFIQDAVEEGHVEWSKVWVIITGGELRDTGLDEDFWNLLAPQHHHRIPPARELIEESLRAGLIPIKVSSTLRDSYQQLLRRLLLEYHAQRS